MSDPTDSLTLSGLGGLYNGEVFVLLAGQAGTVGLTSLASFPVTLCRNYRRLEGCAPIDSLLGRLSPEHVRFLYLGDGRLIVENLADGEIRVGRRGVGDRIELDLTQGRVVVEFGFGERIVAAAPHSPEGLIEFAPPPDPDEVAQGVFVALLAPPTPEEPEEPEKGETEGRETEDREIGYELAPEEPSPPRPTALPPASPPQSGSVEPRRRRRGGPFGRLPAPFLSVLFHLVLLLGLFAYVRVVVTAEESGGIATVEVHQTVDPPRPEEPSRPDEKETVEEEPRDPSEMPPTLKDSEFVHEGDMEGTNPSPLAGGLGDPGIAGLVGVGPGALEPGGAAAGLITPGGKVRTLGGPPVAKALRWLAQHQSKRGFWSGISSVSSCGRCTALANREYPVAMTGIALAAFVDAGHNHRTGEYSDTVRAGAMYLVERQEDDGSFFPEGTPEAERQMYGNGIATFALAELYRHTRSPQIRGTVTRAVRFIERAQAPYAGWRYQPGSRDTDTSVTGWQVLALRSTARGGIRVNPVTKFGVLDWLERVTEPATNRVGYSRRGQGSLGMTATGLTMRLLLGEERSAAEIKAAARLLRANLPFWPEKAGAGPPGNPPDYIYWYFGTIAAARLGGEIWRQWSRAAERALLPHQESRGHLRGSFPPAGRWSEIGGRVFSTAVATLVLELTGESRKAFK